MKLEGVARRHGLALTVGIILVGGMAWFGVDAASDSEPADSGDLYERIDAYVADQLDGSRIPGAALTIVDAGRTVHATGFGSDGHGNPVSADTPFWIGSNTKSITALAVMQLVEDGEVDLDAPVQRYLPDFRVADPAASAAITVRHLVNQTSGIARIDGIKAVAGGGGESMRYTVAQMADLQLNRPVGSSFEYANLNSVVLGVLIEQVTGQTWQDYVEEHIFAPLRMDKSFTDLNAAEDAGLTSTYRSFFGFPLETDAENHDGLAASGYVYSSASDMARYLAMYLNEGALEGTRVLDASTVEEMLSPATAPRTFPLQSQEFTASYGDGWFVGPFGAAETARWHQGSLPHFTAWLVLLPDSDQGVVVLLNEGNQFEFGGANATWSRIPQGVVNLLVGAEPVEGPGSTPFFIIFTTLVLALTATQVWHLARLTRAGIPSPFDTLRAAAPLVWEFGLAGAVLFLYPVLLGGLGWSATFAFLPDLTLTVLVVAGLAVLTGVVRTALLVRRHRHSPTANPTASAGPGDSDQREAMADSQGRQT